ncbi:OmpH family outer membrane protein [Planktotalea sp.]|uniref:OmpH family outer membrane protein n=1 Tax=Planktotalea sp. TaxID=2029877 RepID=UPI003F6BD592
MAALSIAVMAPSGLSAQLNAFSLPEIPVLTIQRERLYSETQFGQSLSREIAERGRRLAAENRRIEQELAIEEGELTDIRETMTPEEFRDLADAFDVKVTGARNEQDQKIRTLTQLSEQAERRFLFTIAPYMQRLMIEKGASVILDRRAVFVSADASDVTLEAIARIDEGLGEGMPLEELLAPIEDDTPETELLPEQMPEPLPVPNLGQEQVPIDN